MTARRCTCDPWAADHECPMHGDDEHRLADRPDTEPVDVPDHWQVTPDPWGPEHDLGAGDCEAIEARTVFPALSRSCPACHPAPPPF